ESYYFDREDQPWARTASELDEIWRQRVKNDALSLMLTGKEWEGDDGVASTLRKRYERVLRRTSQLTADEVFESFMNAYADTLDPHSNYFSPRNTEEYRIQMSLSYEGIGASLQLRDDYVTVMNIIAGGPAAIDGSVEQKDRITAVGQGTEGSLVDVIGWRLDDVVELIRGPGGTTVRLQILPAGAAPGSAEKIVALVRDEVRLEAQAAQRETLDIERGDKAYKVGVIKVPSFYQDYAARQAGRKDYTSTTRDVRRLIGELKSEGMDALIVDLRNNGGGHLWEARAMTGLFIDGPVVQFRETSGRVRQLNDIEPGVAYDGPLAVLVDRYSASASEIFAAAIQDYERGVVIGQNTFGKGSVQNLYDLNRWSSRRSTGDMGQLTLTIGKYYRVTGGSTQLRGVAPDIALPSPVDEELVGESTRDTALNWDQ
ncbi:MAG: S41 family peptidase, partial [Pseudomonadota bacterium]